MKNIMAKGMAQKSCKALLSLRSLGFSRKFAEILLRSKYNWDKKFLGREYTSTTMWQIRKAVFNSNPLKYKFITLNNISLCNIYVVMILLTFLYWLRLLKCYFDPLSNSPLKFALSWAIWQSQWRSEKHAMSSAHKIVKQSFFILSV